MSNEKLTMGSIKKIIDDLSFQTPPLIAEIKVVSNPFVKKGYPIICMHPDDYDTYIAKMRKDDHSKTI